MRFRRILETALALMLCLVPACDRGERVVDSLSSGATIALAGHAFGTTWRVTLTASSRVDLLVREEKLEEKLIAALEVIDSEMSQWREDSTVSRFNRLRTTRPVSVSPALAEVITEACRVHERSLGALDITAGPLVELWGFGSAPRRSRSPSSAEIENALGRVGMRLLTLGPSEGAPAGGLSMAKSNPGLTLDLSALGKGYAVDELARRLDEYGIESYLVDIGGELRARGSRPDGEAWRIGLERPDPGRYGGIFGSVPLRDEAIATSGSYRDFFEDPRTGARRSHVIDPRTGRPIDHDLVSVSVIADSAMSADAWATALLVLGPEDGFRLAEAAGLRARFVSGSTSREWNDRSTSGFPRVVPVSR